MYRGGLLNGVPFFTQPGGPFTKVLPELAQGEIWPDFPGPSQMVYSYGPWVQPSCLHPQHEYTIIQDFDYVLNQPVQLITCSVCSFIQRAVYGTAPNGMPELYDPTLYAVIVA
jgi:hypothetical protein